MTQALPEKLAALMAKTNKSVGASVAGRLGAVRRAHGTISTGLAGIDRVTGGGVPRGQLTQLVGESMAGKSTLMLQIIREAQRQGHQCVFVDTEHRLDQGLAAMIGVDLDSLLYYPPEDGESAVEFIVEAVRSGETGLVVLDSIGALIPSARHDNEVGKAMPAARARLVGEMMERLIAPLSVTNTAMICANHLTGALKSDAYGNQILDPKGGRTLKYLTSALWHLRRTNKPLQEGGETAGYEVTLKIQKNTYGPDNVEVPLVNWLGKGFDPVADLAETALRIGAVESRGAWVYLTEDVKFQGKAKFVEALGANPEVFARVRARVVDGEV